MMNLLRHFLVVTIFGLGLLVSSHGSQGKLTPERITELTATTKEKGSAPVVVEISGFGSAELSGTDLHGKLENIREFRYPDQFQPPQVLADKSHPAVIPTTPTNFETINAGWTIQLHAQRLGKLVMLRGTAEFVDVKMVNGAYGALAGPVYDRQGNVLTANFLQQPEQHSTITRFHVSAVPGEAYEILFYKGSKVETHTVKVLVR